MATRSVNPMVDGDTGILLVALLAAFAFAGLVFALLYPYVSGEKQTEKRVASVTETRTKKTTGTRSAADIAAQRKKQVSESLKDMEARAKSREKVSIRTQLERAGLDAEPRAFWIASAVFGVVVAAIIFIWMGGGSGASMAAFTALLIGTFGVPRWVLNKLVKRRQKKFQSELANAIDVVVRGVKSGLPLNECLQIIARESPEPIAGEFRYVVEQMRVGIPLGEALDRLIVRMPLAEVKFLAIVISIQQQAGGNLSEALGNLSGVLRDRFRMEMKVKALSAEAKSSAGVLGSLPPGVMFMTYMSSPDYIMPLFNTTVGNLLMLVGAFWMFCGIMVMKKMINFKF
jgi:tight adherence protein B